METNGNQMDGTEGDGNTNPSVPKPRTNQLKRWCFTFNNYKLGDTDLLSGVFNKVCTKWVFQEEIGETGTPHLQGAIWLKKPQRWEEFKLPKGIHWSKMDNEEASAKYCVKEETRSGAIFKNGWPPELEYIIPTQPWQLDIINLLNVKPNGRSVHWFYDEIGGIGKSQFCRYMRIKYDVWSINGGSFSDICNIIFNMNTDYIKMIIFDLPKETGGHISYRTLECVLNGMITNTKYETGTKIFNPPHVIVLANKLPSNMDALSADRWKITNLRD